MRVSRCDARSTLTFEMHEERTHYMSIQLERLEYNKIAERTRQKLSIRQ